MERYFDLYLNAGVSVPLVINANQYDKSETWLFTLYDETGIQFRPASGSIVGLKADGNTIANAGTVNSSGQVVIQETEQITAVAGKNEYELILDASHGTANFVVLVERRPGDNATPSESDLSLIEQAIEAASNITQVVELTNIVNSVRSEMTNFIADNAGLPNETTLSTDEIYRVWKSSAATPTGGKTVLSAKVTDYDVIAVYTTISTLGGSSTTPEAHYFNAQDFADKITTVVCGTSRDSATSKDMYVPMLSLICDSDEKTITCSSAKLVAWNGTASSDATVTESDSTNVQGSIVRIAGIRNDQLDTEVVNARVGKNGTQYNTLKARLDAETAIVDSSLTVSGAAADAKKTGDEIGDLKSQIDTYVISKYETVNPVNMWNDAEASSGVMAANGTISENTSRCYSDYIPVTAGDVIRYYYRSSATKIYRRNICCFDSAKQVLASKGSDSAGQSAWTVPADVSFIRITIDSTYRELAIITINNDNVPSYVAYFEPYEKITEDFLTEETEQFIDSLKAQDDNRGYAMPMGREIYMTVGIPEKWYYKSMMSPDFLKSNIAIGQAYSQRENDGVSFPNDTALESSNGYSFTVYDQNLNSIYRYAPNSGYGLPRHIKAENLQNCTALIIGDSTVDFDTMTASMLNYFTQKGKTLTLLGTLGDGSGTNKNEGRAGWKATDYLTDKQYNGVVNPFYNSSTQTFDFSYYMTNQNYSSVDFVIIQLGINDLYNSDITVIEPTWAAIQTMISSIRTYSNSVKIILNLPTTPNSDQSKHSVFLPLYFNRVARYNQYVQNKVATLYNTSAVRCSYCHLILDPDTDIRDNVHPTTAGFEKMALEIVNQINNWQNGV